MSRSVAVLIVALVLSGCVGPTGPNPVTSTPTTAAMVPPAHDPSSAPASPASPAPPSEEPLPSDLDPDLRHAIESRRGLGLRHDLAYVLQVAADPAARNQLLDFPMYPEEEAKFLADQQMQDEAIPVIQAYAARHAAVFGGLYIDRGEHPGAVASLWTHDLDVHESAIRESLPPGTPLIFRQVRYSEAFLRAIQHRISADWDWMRSIPAAPESAGVDIIDNVAEVGVSSADPRAEAIIREHYGLGDELRVVSDGTGAALLPWGKVIGVVLGPNGKRIGQNDLMLDAVSADPGQCGGGDMGFGIVEDGTFEYPCQVGTRTIQVKKFKGPEGSGEWVVIGEATVRLIGTGAVAVRIRLTEAP